jgi:HSP20 family protein
MDRQFSRFGFGGTGSTRGSPDIFREFEDMRRDMQRMFEEALRDVEHLPKDLVREYESPAGGKVREVGPIVYGYSVTVGPDGKPRVHEFGNIRAPSGMTGSISGPELTAEREPLADIITTDKEVKVVVEMPGITKENVRVSAYNDSIEISTEGSQRKYRKVIELPSEADMNTARSTFNNGILEILFNKKEPSKGKQIKIE